MPTTSLGKRIRLANTDYTVACLVPLGVELAPLRAMLDTIHDDIVSKRDHNAYILGSLGEHNVVVAVLPSIGNNDSGVVANQLVNDFPRIRFGLLVGIAGGIPDIERHDIRLGDVVVSEPTGRAGGVVQLDRGKRHSEGRFEITGHLNKPSPLLIASMKKLKAQHLQEGNRVEHFISDMMRRYPRMQEKFSHPGLDNDNLFEATYEHVSGGTCQDCDIFHTVKREKRREGQVNIHYGTIGSSNAVLKSALERDRIGREFDVLSVEMEAAGVMDTLPCLVIRGICDYADSHKNKQWQPYSAAVAAAYTKELLQSIPAASLSESVKSEPESLPLLSRSSDLTIEGYCQDERSSAQFDDLLQSLYFDRVDTRLRTIVQALPQTCKWLFKHDDFQVWAQRDRVREHCGFFWIKGKPGSGKSTIMKTTFEWAKKHWPTDLTVSYFFNARASGKLEKSSLGFYRTLTHQLLSAYPQLREPFLTEFRYKSRGAVFEDWTELELKTFLNRSIQDLKNRPLNIFVDALDEGDENDVRQMIGFLEDLSINASSTNASLRICLSSRHFPYISIRKGLSLVMEHQAGHEEDLKAYIQTKLTNDGSEDMTALQNEILQKSASMFLWAVLVIPILNRAYDTGKSVNYVSQCLATIPEELDDLFTQILAQSNEDIEECLSLLQWVLFSRTSLSPDELDMAIRSTLTPPRFSDDKTSVERYLLNTSRGLTEITTTNPPTVQFIHETVREFLQRVGLARIDKELAGNVRGLSHDKLKIGCYQYLNENSLDLLSRVASKKLFKKPFSQKLFLEYAVKHIFWHAEMAESYGIPQGQFLDRYFTSAESMHRVWVHTRNFFQKYNVHKYSTQVSLLYIFAEYGHEHLMDLLIKKQVDIDAIGERFGSALQAACASGSEKIVRRLIDAGAQVNLEAGEFEHALCTAIHYKRDRIMNILIQKEARPRSGILTKCLYKTIARGYSQGVQALLDVGAEPNYHDSNKSTPLIFAINHYQAAIVDVLIKNGSDVNATCSCFGSALDVALFKININVIEALLRNGAGLTAVRRSSYASKYNILLDRAVRRSKKRTVQLLLDKITYIDVRPYDFASFFKTALSVGNGATVRLLIDAGVKLDTWTYLKLLDLAGISRNLEAVRLLIDAEVDGKRLLLPYQLETALRTARTSGNEYLEKLLLEVGSTR